MKTSKAEFHIVKNEDGSLTARARHHPYDSCGVGHGTDVIMRIKRAFIDTCKHRIDHTIKFGYPGIWM